jgi:hypothetical protein
MWEPQIDIPNPYTLGKQWGIGWILDEWSGHKVISHGGNTIGQHAMLWLVPDTGTVVCVTANGGQSGEFTRAVATELFAELDGLTVPPSPTLPETPSDVDVTPYAGVYERVGARMTVSVLDDGKARLLFEATGELAALQEPEESDFVPVDENLFLFQAPGTRDWMAAVFFDLADGTRYVHLGARATPKVS